ncbi:MAG: substrate-binding domain-containing protein, partial [Xanthomonadales bacterium]|nr:substrate-binding domain-containing protein [Xanthomonadales bacterium]
DMAAGAMKVAHELGLGIPNQLSIAGFDDIPLASQVWPSLTTVKQPIQKMGELAAELLLRRFRQQSAEKFERITKSQIVVRDSTGPAP